MDTAIKIALTALAIAMLAWPLMFWGEPGLTQDSAYSRERTLPSPVIERHEMLW